MFGLLVGKNEMTSSNFWAQGLLKTLNDKSKQFISSNNAVVIKDMYPKAKIHYLVLPKEDIATIFDLLPKHLSLLEEMHSLALNAIELKQREASDFKIGFHAEPSMQRVHLHVISKDFVSDCLKNKKHWNSFNTDFFRPYEDVYEELKSNGAVRRFDKEKLEHLLKSELLCNQCKFIGKNIPKLKQHLQDHLDEKLRNP